MIQFKKQLHRECNLKTTTADKHGNSLRTRKVKAPFKVGYPQANRFFLMPPTRWFLSTM